MESRPWKIGQLLMQKANCVMHGKEMGGKKTSYPFPFFPTPPPPLPLPPPLAGEMLYLNQEFSQGKWKLGIPAKEAKELFEEIYI